VLRTCSASSWTTIRLGDAFSGASLLADAYRLPPLRSMTEDNDFSIRFALPRCTGIMHGVRTTVLTVPPSIFVDAGRHTADGIEGVCECETWNMVHTGP